MARSRANWGQVKATFLAALDEPLPSRPSLLDRLCGVDTALRREVESLLASDEAAGTFAERPAASLVDLDSAPATPPGRALAPGDRVGAFVIRTLLGSGGMGHVYLADDTKLQRQVAIKTLNADGGGVAARARLLKEAQSASRLRHANICAMHEASEDDGLPFIVMEYIEGTPLDVLLRDGPRPLNEAMAIGRQISAGVAHSHERGIVHRDLKSSNVIVNPGRGAVVLDFGLAGHLPQADGPSTETSVGARGMAGTLSYMAPEVLHGRRADARSDVWAIGVMLHEMVTGSRPFRGQTDFEVSSAILGEAPAGVSRQVPLAVRLLILKCLEKDPARRYQRTADLAAALEDVRLRRLWPLAGAAIGSRKVLTRGGAALLVGGVAMVGGTAVYRSALAPVVPTVASLALLPLETTATGSADTSYADEMTATLIADLGALKDVRVIARASALRFRDSGRAPADIGRELGVDAVVQGTVTRAADRTGISVRAVAVDSGRTIWSDRFERRTREVLVLQADVVRGVAAALQVALRAEVRDRLTTVRAVDPDVYEAFLKGLYQWNRRTEPSVRAAVEQFERAIALDPTYAPAHAALADCYNQLASVLVSGGSPRVWRPRAAAAAVKALQLDPGSAEAHASLGYTRHYEWKWVEAERLLRRAIELNPSLPRARIWYANLLMSLGRFDEAVDQVFVARELDPFSPVVNTNVGWVLTFAGRAEEAVTQLSRTIELSPDYPQAHQRLSGALSALGRFDEALASERRAVELDRRSAASRATLAHTLAEAGRHEETRAILRDLIASMPEAYVSPGALAGIYVTLGETETGLTWLERAYEERSNKIAYLAVEDTWQRVREHPRFERILKGTGLR